MGISLKECKLIRDYFERISKAEREVSIIIDLINQNKFDDANELLKSLEKFLRKELPTYYRYLISTKKIEGLDGININELLARQYVNVLTEFRKKLLEKESVVVNLSNNVESYDIGGSLRKNILLVYPGQKFEVNPFREDIKIAIKLAEGRVIWGLSSEDLYGEFSILHPDNPLSEAFRYYEPRINRSGSYFIITKVDNPLLEEDLILPADALETVINSRRRAFSSVNFNKSIIETVRRIIIEEVEKLNKNYGFKTSFSKTLFKYVLRMVGKTYSNIPEWIGKVRDFYIISHFSYVFSGKLPYMILETSSFEGNPKGFRRKIRKVNGGSLNDI